MILTKLKEAKQIDDITLTPEEKAFADEVKDLDPLFSGLRNNSIKVLRNIWLSDQQDAEDNFEKTAESFLDWFDEQYADFGHFVADNYERIPLSGGRSSKDQLPVFVIRDLALNDENFADALRQIALKWRCIDENNIDRDLGTPVDIEDIVEILFLHCCSKGVRSDLVYDNESNLEKIPDKNVRDVELLKVLADEIKEKINIHDYKRTHKPHVEPQEEGLNEEHVCEKCGKSPCICEAEEEQVSEQEPIAEIPEEPAEAPIIEEPHQDVPEAVFSDMINSAIQKEWDFISHINSLIATFDFDYKEENKEDIKAIFNQLLDDTTINIGMLHKAAELVSSKQAELMGAGEEKAEQIISEPSQDLE